MRGAVEPVVAELLADEEREHGGGAVERDVADAVLVGEAISGVAIDSGRKICTATRANRSNSDTALARQSYERMRARTIASTSEANTTAGRATKRRNLSRPFSTRALSANGAAAERRSCRRAREES